MHVSIKHAIRERLNDLRNYRAHIQLFPQQLPVDVDPRVELQKVSSQMNDLRRQLIEEAA